ncbi:MAG: hypothetical protein ACOCSF_07860 [Halanaeroarchaeum sp.]
MFVLIGVVTTLLVVFPLQFCEPFVDPLDLVSKGLPLRFQLGDPGFVAAMAARPVTLFVV